MNPLKVIGFAWESGKLKALVLEYMENCNLDTLIHEHEEQLKWNLPKRIDIMVSVAKGVAYLHSGYGIAIVHCDLKPSNIFLGRDWDAHVSDFGTARMLGVRDNEDQSSSISSSSVGFQGTIGYIAPATTEVDTFSFGILTMELMTARRPTGVVGEDGLTVTLKSLVRASLVDDERLYNVIDPSLAAVMTEEQVDVLRQVLNLALICTSDDLVDRPNINTVLSVLVKQRKNFEVPCSVKSDPI